VQKKQQGIIFVIDSNDRDYMKEAISVFDSKVNVTKYENLPLLLFCKKMDLSNTMPVEEIVDILHLKEIKRPYHVQSLIATTGEGFFEGLNWIEKIINE
jgi:signal recognition particle receptor subunit beta